MTDAKGERRGKEDKGKGKKKEEEKEEEDGEKADKVTMSDGGAGRGSIR